MPRTHTVTNWSSDGLRAARTDAEWHSRHDSSPSIGQVYASLGRIANPTRRTCETVAVFGANSRISGPVKGDPPALGISQRLNSIEAQHSRANRTILVRSFQKAR